MISVTAVDNRLYSYGKSKLGLNSLTKMKRCHNFTHDSLLAIEKVVGHILLHIARRYLFHIFNWIM